MAQSISLTNGAKLSYKLESSEEYIQMKGLEEIPEWSDNKEEIKVFDLSEKTYYTAYGVAEAESKEYPFHITEYPVTASSLYAVLKGYSKSNTVLDFKEELENGIVTTFKAIPSVTRTGGGANEPVKFTLTLAVQGESGEKYGE